MELLDPTLWIIITCAFMVAGASALGIRLHDRPRSQSEYRLAHVNIMALGRARLIETLESTVDVNKPIRLNELHSIVEETMSLIHFLDIYPGMRVRPHVVYHACEDEVVFMFSSPLTRVVLEYHIPKSSYLLP